MAIMYTAASTALQGIEEANNPVWTLTDEQVRIEEPQGKRAESPLTQRVMDAGQALNLGVIHTRFRYWMSDRKLMADLWQNAPAGWGPIRCVGRCWGGVLGDYAGCQEGRQG